MCYMLLLGTDATEDLSARNTELMTFSKELPGLPEEQCLELSQKWYVGSAHGCSCGFRHLYIGSVELGFGVPEEWYPEAPEDLEATSQFVEVVKSLLAAGHRVECIDAWCHGSGSAKLAATVQVNLREVAGEAFRFFENHRFVFSGGT